MFDDILNFLYDTLVALGLILLLFYLIFIGKIIIKRFPTGDLNMPEAIAIGVLIIVIVIIVSARIDPQRGPKPPKPNPAPGGGTE